MTTPVPDLGPDQTPELLEKLAAILPAVLDSGRFVPAAVDMVYRSTVADISARAGYTVQYEPGGASADDVFDAMTHQAIYDGVSQFAPDGLVQMGSNWRALGDMAATDAGDFAAGIGAVVGDGWRGTAASAAGDGVKRYSASAIELLIAAHTFASKVSSAQSGLERTKSSVPAPDPITRGDRLLDVFASVGNLMAPGFMKTSQFERDEAEEQARTVMKTVYQPSIRQAGREIPVLPQALDPTGSSPGSTGADVRAVSGSNSASPGSTPYASQTGSQSGQGGSSFADASSAQESSGATDAASAQDTATQASSWAPSDSATGGSPSTSPAASNQPTTGGAAGGSTAGMPAGGLPGSPASDRIGGRSRTGAGAGGAGSGGVGSGGVGSGGVGSGRVGSGGLGAGGAPLGGSPGGPVSATTATGQGRAGAPGMGGMGAGAGRGGPGAEDDVHKTPGYLIDAVNGDELIGTLPLVAPPVLGE